MYSIDNYIGQTVRRCIFMLKKKDGLYYHLFSVIEHLTEDMQDYDAFPPNMNGVFIDFVKKANGSKEKVFFAVDYVSLSKEMVYSPWDNIYVGKDKINSDCNDYKWRTGNPCTSNVVPLHDDKDELCALLPKRHYSAFVNYCKPGERGEAVELVLNSDLLRKQLRDLSVRNLGYDLTKNPNFWGTYVFATYNPIYDTLSFREDSDALGLYCRVNYREGRHDKISLVIRGLDNNNNTLFDKLMCTEEGIFLYHISFDKPFHHLDITVYDAAKKVIDYYPYVVFIHSIQVSMQVKSKEMVITDEEGNTLKTVEKYVEEKPLVVGSESQIDSLWDTSDEFAYEKLEKALDFVFFEGGKESSVQATNRDKAKDCIMRILNSAHRVCYLCDVYFDASAFRDFIWEMKCLSVEVRIISSKADLNADKKSELKALIEEYNGKVGGKVFCRLLRGEETILHDRFIVADDNVWMLGCSLNTFGRKATTLIRVPKAYRKKLIDTAEKWWNDSNYSEEL